MIYNLNNGCLVIQPDLENAYLHIDRVGDNEVNLTLHSRPKFCNQDDCCTRPIPYLIALGDHCPNPDLDVICVELNPCSYKMTCVEPNEDADCPSAKIETPSAITIIPRLDAFADDCDLCAKFDELIALIKSELDETQTQIQELIDAGNTP